MTVDPESDFEYDDYQEDSGSDFEDYTPTPKKARKSPAPAKTKEPASTSTAKSSVKKTPAKKAVSAQNTKATHIDSFFSKASAASLAPSSSQVSASSQSSSPVTSKKTATSVDADGDIEMEPASKPASKTTKKMGYDENKTIEEIYQKKTQLEHILLRPDTYIGSIETEEQEMFVYDTEADMIKKKKIRYVPGLYKIVDEILVNAADNKIRDPSMTWIKVQINREENFISIQNNGRGIPITMHKEEQVYVPELIFGHLLTSSNYDDNEKKVTGGRNGYGAKLCNIFSTEFTVETADKERQKKYKQVFKDNMSVIGKPHITANSRGEEYTRISFKPDLAKFHLTEMDADFEALIKKRVYDLAGCVKDVSVYLNGTKITIKTFGKYCELYTKALDFRNAENKKPIISDTASASDRWEVHFGVSDGQFNQISFVNSICTAKGGMHVNHVVDQIIKAILPEVQKKTNNKNVKPFQVKNHMNLFVNCLIENPSFDSQTKENMTLRASAFGSKYEPSEKFIKAILQSGIIDNIIRWVKFKEDEQMSKADSGKMSRRLNIPKLEDAHLAGVKPHNKDCTLILTEGDSAKSLVLSGLSVVGRDKFGVFPLRGKVLNVRDATNQQIMNNEEITSIKAILGLKHGKEYTSVDELRYGKLMLMTDQDHDGSHIKGLLINFIDVMFPSLLDIPGFLLEFITPIIRCKHKRTKREISFFTIPEYEAWAEENNRNKEWQPKYYKGLGTSDATDARTYFSALDIHKKEFDVASREERELVDMAFNKKRATDRKTWLQTYEPGIYIDHNVSKIKITDFVNRELMLFSMADNIRSIPSVVDGFKPGQRKVLYSGIKRNTNSEIKVAQFANYVASVTQYHHGEASVAATVINMAQNFAGSNNINLLVPAGQFGTRHCGGKSAASPRYLFTRLHKIARFIYHPDDDDLLDYLIEESMSIEPKWYIPIIPMVLVNGADGIGTGWSTNIPNYNPMDIIDNLFRLMNDEEIVPMVPWYRGFKGEMIPAGPGKFITNGKAEVDEATGHIKVTELPVRFWTDTFKKNLDIMRDGKDRKVEVQIIDYFNNSTDVAVEFRIDIDEENLRKAEKIGLTKALKITDSISTNNIVCFDKDGKIRKYESPEEILKEFYELRLEYYRKRKEHLIYVLTDEYERLENKAKFIELVINRELTYFNRKHEDVVADMKKFGLKEIFPRKKSALVVEEGAEQKPADDESEDSSGYSYLFDIKVREFTAQKVIDLTKKRDLKYEMLEETRGTPPTTFWRRDLEKLKKEWESLLEEDEENAKQAKPMATSQTKKRKRTLKPKAPKTAPKA
ncbi:DNA topoisomerase [Mycotypha africana]|uniref:DNA topoisomerase n=1 Tax=Mycotypha africana TaxID=64632 RepID=UPI0022FFE3F2|nr:DNA topoisomerase [Mycotypha africana]KAI8973430.1 DNA topoisomerase [Mycotypha africana]